MANLHTLLAHINLPQADWLGLRWVKEVNTVRYVRDGIPQTNSRSSSHGIMVEVLANGQFGYGSTNFLDQANVQTMAEGAYQQAIAAAPWAVHQFTTAQRPKATGQYHSPYLIAGDAMAAGEINDRLIQICHHLKVSPNIVKTTAYLLITEVETQFVSSNGSDVYQKFLLMATDFGAIAQDGNIIQQRSDHGQLARCHQAGLEIIAPELVLGRAELIGQQALALLRAEDCPNTTTSLVLAPDQMLLQIHESVGHPLELDRILGDERNYAGSSFVKLSDFGKLVYGSPLLNITFDPSHVGEYASAGFDDVGMPATREYLIKDGLLLRGLGSYDSQARSQVPGVASTRACSWNRPPIDRMANLNLELGNSSFADIIGGIDHGVYMQSNRSWSIDDYRQKFQFGCEYAQLIENGRLTKILRNPNYRSITTQFWHSLTKVGDRSEAYGTPICGKGEPNQAIRVGHASPVCLFENIEVFS